MLALALIPSVLFAINFKLAHPCSGELIIDNTPIIELPAHVGTISLNQLQLFAIKHTATINSMISINNTPTGTDALEVINEAEFYSYGWCFSINGQVPNKLMNQVEISQEDTIFWFFGNAHYKDGEWLTYCSEKNLRRLPSYCL